MRCRRALLVGASVLLAATSTAGAQTSITNLPPGRIVPMTPRVVGLSARVVPLTPRVVSVAPKQTAPRTFKVQADVLFAFGRAALSPNAQAVLSQVVNRLPHSGTVTILGYTDSIGTVKYNLGLSARRAAAVQAFLQTKAPSLTYRSRGLGEADPVAPNSIDGHDNPAGRQQNRRVVISYS
jgi:outer membrane protein OmpA-like peptidoglycan-associated protein